MRHGQAPLCVSKVNIPRRLRLLVKCTDQQRHKLLESGCVGVAGSNLVEGGMFRVVTIETDSSDVVDAAGGVEGNEEVECHGGPFGRVNV